MEGVRKKEKGNEGGETEGGGQQVKVARWVGDK